MKILLISSVIPQNTTATELVLYRHFAAAEGLVELTIASDHPKILKDPTQIPVYPNAWLKRLARTRITSLAHSLLHLSQTYNVRYLNAYLQKYRPDLIITVAEGQLWIIAMEAAQKFSIPLVTFFHDWWPDLTFASRWSTSWLTSQMQLLAKRSALNFCVSQGMQNLLQEPVSSCILYPIPGSIFPSEPKDRDISKNTVVYAGNLLGRYYGEPLQKLANESIDTGKFQLKLFGKRIDWSEKTCHHLKTLGIYHGFVDSNELIHHLSTAGILLVVMSFSPTHRRIMSSSFPSKLVEYCRFGRPILIWGPPYCTAVQWAKKFRSAKVVTESDTKSVVQAIQALFDCPNEYQRLAERSIELSMNLFNHDRIQKDFMTGLRKATRLSYHY